MPVRAVTFDVYSAMLDTVGGLMGALRAFFHQRGVTNDAAPMARAWRRARICEACCRSCSADGCRMPA